MTVKFTVIDTASGRTLRTGATMTMATAMLQAGPGETVIPVASNPEVELVKPDTGTTFPLPIMSRNGSLTAVNKTNIAANGVEFLTISNIPNGAGYHFVLPNDQGLAPIVPATVADGVLEITTTVKGAYTVILTYPNMQNFKVNFNAT